MRELTRIVDVRTAAKAKAVSLRGLRRVRVHKVVAPSNGLKQRPSISQKTRGALQPLYERDKFILSHYPRVCDDYATRMSR